MARPNWKFNHLNLYIYKNVFLNEFKKIKLKKVFCRSSITPKIFLKKNISLYKGCIFTRIAFTKYNIGYKIGEFAITRKPFCFPLKKIKNKR